MSAITKKLSIALATLTMAGAAFVGSAGVAGATTVSTNLDARCKVAAPLAEFRTSTATGNHWGGVSLKCSASYTYTISVKKDGVDQPALKRSFGPVAANTASSGTTLAIPVVPGSGYQLVVLVKGASGSGLGYFTSGAEQVLVKPVATAREERAITWMMDHRGATNYEGRCELAVENAFGTSGKFLSARAAWDASVRNGVAHTSTNPPRGALVYWNTSSNAHVAISLGDGKVISTSSGSGIGIVSVSYFQNYLGWAPVQY